MHGPGLPSKPTDDGGDVLSKPADNGGGVDVDPRAGHNMGPDWSYELGVVCPIESPVI